MGIKGGFKKIGKITSVASKIASAAEIANLVGNIDMSNIDPSSMSSIKSGIENTLNNKMNSMMSDLQSSISISDIEGMANGFDIEGQANSIASSLNNTTSIDENKIELMMNSVNLNENEIESMMNINLSDIKFM